MNTNVITTISYSGNSGRNSGSSSTGRGSRRDTSRALRYVFFFTFFFTLLNNFLLLATCTKRQRTATTTIALNDNGSRRSTMDGARDATRLEPLGMFYLNFFFYFTKRFFITNYVYEWPPPPQHSTMTVRGGVQQMGLETRHVSSPGMFFVVCLFFYYTNDFLVRIVFALQRLVSSSQLVVSIVSSRRATMPNMSVLRRDKRGLRCNYLS